MYRSKLSIPLALLAAMILGAAAPDAAAKKKPKEVPLSIAKIYFEYNSSANDLGVHVVLDGEHWTKMKIVNPRGRVIFQVEGKKAYKELGMTELFFEGAEPNLDDVPLDVLLALFPEGEYDFEGVTVDGDEIEGEGRLSHAIPAGPEVEADVGPGSKLVIRWSEVDAPPEDFPGRRIDVVAYQVIVGSFQVTLPAGRTSVTVPPEFVETLASGEQLFEVLAIEANGNQTLTEGSFDLP